VSSSAQKSKTKPKKCILDGCHRTTDGYKVCETHRQRMHRTGSYKLKQRNDPRAPVEHFRAKKTPRSERQEKLRVEIDGAVKRSLPTLDLETAEVFEPLLADLIRYLGAKGGRGSGKSHFFAELLVERCVMNPTTRAVCIREKQISLGESVKTLIEDKIKKMKVGHRFRSVKTHIEVLDKRGNVRGRIIFRGMQKVTADALKSLEAFDIAWVEEAQSLSAHSWSLLRPTIRKKGSQIWCSWNPVDPDDPVDAFFHEALKADRKDVALVEANYFHNPWFGETTLNEDMEYDKRRDNDRWLHVWCGKYRKHSSARVFKNWRVGTREEFATLRVQKLTPRYGGDWGFSKDPTVGIKVKIDDENRTLYIEREVYAIGCEIDRSPALFDELDGGAARKYPLVADSARPETISYMRRHGYPLMKPARKGAGSIEEGVEFIKTYDVVIHPDCLHTIDEFTHYSYKVDEKTETVLAILDDRKNHVIDAVRYAVESVRHKARAGVLF
jgi:phage terminase large subunit